MPEFRRGIARWLPRKAERDLFHPSLEDLRADGVTGLRLTIATAALWLDCWRVWLTNRGPAHTGRRTERHSPPKEYFAMFIQDVRRALRLFRMEPGFAAAIGTLWGATRWTAAVRALASGLPRFARTALAAVLSGSIA